MKALVTRESDVELETWSDPVRGRVSFRTMFGQDHDTEFTAGVASLEGGGWLGQHRHEPSEIYYVLSGNGVVSLEGEERPVSAGTAVHIPSNVEHGIRNTGSDCLRFFYAFAIGSFGDIEYAFAAHQ